MKRKPNCQIFWFVLRDANGCEIQVTRSTGIIDCHRDCFSRCKIPQLDGINVDPGDDLRWRGKCGCDIDLGAVASRVDDEHLEFLPFLDIHIFSQVDRPVAGGLVGPDARVQAEDFSIVTAPVSDADARTGFRRTRDRIGSGISFIDF